MYLSRLLLNPRSAQARRDLGDCHDLHRTLMSAFPQAPAGEPGRSYAGVLFRNDLEREPLRRPCVLVQSRLAPDWRALPDGYLASDAEVKDLDCALAGLRAGQALRFRLRANPTRSAPPRGATDRFGRGQRVPLRNDPRLPATADDEDRRAWRSGEQKCLDWLARKGDGDGFRLATVARSPFFDDERADLPDVRVAIEDDLRGGRADRYRGGERRQLTFSPVLFEGRLEVVDADALREAVAKGIGPAKAYGCGLLSLARA